MAWPNHTIILSPYLCLDLIFAAKHIINTSEIVDTFGNGRRISRWYIALLKMSFLPKLAHLCPKVSQVVLNLTRLRYAYLVVNCRCYRRSCCQTLLDVQYLLHSFRTAVDFYGE